MPPDTPDAVERSPDWSNVLRITFPYTTRQKLGAHRMFLNFKLINNKNKTHSFVMPESTSIMFDERTWNRPFARIGHEHMRLQIEAPTN